MNARWLAGKVARGAADAGVRARLQLLPLPGDGRPDDPARPAAAVDPGGDREAEGRLRPRQAAARPVRRLRRRHPDARPRHQPADPRAGLGRDQGRAPVDAAAGRHRDAVRDRDRRLDGGGGRDQARQEDRRRLARLQPVHLRGARVLDRDHPDPRLRGRDPDLPGGPAGDARGRVLELVRARRSTSPTTWSCRRPR